MSSRKSTFTLGSTYSRRGTTQGQSQLERLHTEARDILSQKQKQIEQFNSAIDDAEQELSKLKQQIKNKNAEMEQFENDNYVDDHEQHEGELEDLHTDQENEIQMITQKHEDTMKQMRAQFEKSLQEAEQWVSLHAETIYTEKSSKLEELQRQLETIRAHTAESAFSATKQRSKLYQESRNATLMNSQRIQHLESQLSELASLTREEVRDVRSKIEECLVAIEIREHEHSTETAKYERELQQREEKYNSHLASLQEQFTAEKARLEQQVEAANKKTETLTQLLRQLERQQGSQLETTLHDIEKMKSTIYQTKTRADQELQVSRTQISAVQGMKRECREKEQELGLIQAEIKDLEEENLDLRAELQRLDTKMYGQAF